MPTKMHVVSHTHWDREWYQPYQIFRARLVACVDAMLDLLERDPRYRYFHLDGQTVVLEDYLEIRPERESRLKALIGEGRVLVGPWYTQPDEFLVSGEALVRNLLLGTRLAKSFGGCMNLGYLPDAFGHASQMPQIFTGFGFEAAVVFRGVTADQVPCAFRWRGADGSQIIALKMSDDDAYSNYLYRLKDTLSQPGPVDAQRLAGELDRLRADCEAVAVCDQHLWMDGVDHVFPNPKTPDIIEFAGRHMPDACVAHSTLPAYARALIEARPQLVELQGELRRANRGWRLQALLANVACSHVRIKQANVRAQVALERVVEPVCSLAWLSGQPYPRSHLAVAWKLLLQNHAHDSICGCSVDQVHREMHYRFDQVMQIAGVVQEQALEALAAQVDTSYADGGHALLLFNPLPQVRRGTLVCEVPVPLEINGKAPPDVVVHDASGRRLEHQLLAVRDSARLSQSPYDIPHPVRRRTYTLALDAELPGYGFGAYRILPAAVTRRSSGTLFSGATAMENDVMRAQVETDGTLTLTHKPSGRSYRGLLALEDGGDGGEGWNWVPPRFDAVYRSPGSPVEVVRVADGPLVAGLRVRLDFEVPVGFEGAADESDPMRMRRSARTVGLPVEISLWLGARCEQLDLEFRIGNQAKNHRLRVLFPTSIPASVCYADTAFDVVERSIRQIDSHDWQEPQLGTYPHHSFVCLGDEQGGLAVFTAGTMEYEVLDEPSRTIAITLLRAFGRGPGEPHEYVDSQEQGQHEYRMALRPFSGDWRRAGVLQDSRAFTAAPLVWIGSAQAGSIEPGRSLLTVEGQGIDVTAVKLTEERDSLIVRCVNLTDEEQTVTLATHTSIGEAYRLSLAEERETNIQLQPDGTVRQVLEPRRIATVELVRGQSDP